MKQTDCTGKMPVKNMLCLLLATFLWGVAFVAQSIGGEEIDAFAYTGIHVSCHRSRAAAGAG